MQACGGGGGGSGSGSGGANGCVKEVCGDGIDNDCDGVVDNGCCSPGQTIDCYYADPATKGVGPCVSGKATCDGTGTPGPCVGQVVPNAETCNGVDDDCNGKVDDGLGTTTCGKGACEVTVDSCKDGQMGTCTPLSPKEEICNGLDDNCDGQVDEGCACDEGSQQPCYSGSPTTLGVGECARGTQTCKGGMWGTCEGAVTPSAETCDGKDNDCNGLVDDGLGTTICGVGACKVEVPACQNGAPTTCTPGTAATEVCNGIDDDCNGLVDDGLPDVSCGVGACAVTVPSCMGGQPNPCVPKQNTPEICDGLDNNCDGQVDEGTITCGVGACAVTVPMCVGGAPNTCTPGNPTPEVCDGVDNDCNGQVDDGTTSCGLGACKVTVPLCTNGLPSSCVPKAPTTEICDGIDNNCDGVVDNVSTNPIVYFNETFSSLTTTWTLGPEWQIGPAATSSCQNWNGPDPATDHTSTSDNRLAGVAIGGCENPVVHGYYYLTSPVINAAVTTPLFLEYWRWLNSDYDAEPTLYMQNDVEVYNGTTWVAIWVSDGPPGVNDTAWTYQSFDVSAYKNANFRVRFGFQIGSTSVFTVSSWNIDDVRLVSAVPCP